MFSSCGRRGSIATVGRAVAALVLWFLANSAMAAPRRAVLIDGEGPWRDQNWKIAAHEFQRLLRDAGYQVHVVAPTELSLLASDDLVAVPSLERLPLGAFKSIDKFVSLGGDLLATGGEPFREPLYRSGGRWVSVSELLAAVKTAKIVFQPASAMLQRSSYEKAEPISESTVTGPDGNPTALRVTIPNLVAWDTLSVNSLPESPFVGGANLTIVWVRGAPGQRLTIEWRERDKSRWEAVVPLAAKWRRLVLPPSAFRFSPGTAEQWRKHTHFQPEQACAIAFGLSTSLGSKAGPAEYEIGPVGVAVSPGRLDEFEAPILETISPWYKQYDAMRRGHGVRIPIVRARGLTAALESEGRYRVVGELLNPAATRYFRINGGALIWVPWPEMTGKDRSETVELLRDTSLKVALLNGGAKDFVALAGEPVVLGAQVKNASREPVGVDVTWTIAGMGMRHARITLVGNESEVLSAPDLPSPPPGEYRVETVLKLGSEEIDRIHGYLRVLDPRTTRVPSQRIRVANGHFTVGGKRIFLNGVNYSPRYVSGLEPTRYLNDWLTPRDYDPDIVEADLDLISQLGMNLVSISASQPESARPLMDFLERCRKHGFWANIFIGSAGNLQPNPDRDKEILTSAYLPGNDRVFAYDLSWEPRLGDHRGRAIWDKAWRDWIDEQYGSVEEAEKAWGMEAPRDDAGLVTNPTDTQITTDGPHRIMVAAYRRFADDLISRVYGRVIRRLRALDPDALMGVRTGYGGTGQPPNNAAMGYDLAAGAAHLDFISPEGYGMPPEFDAARGSGFITAYGRYAGYEKPVFWSEFGLSVGPDGAAENRRVQALLDESTLRVAADSDADGAAVWWWPGGWRVNEKSDYGIVNPDGTPRQSAMILGEWGRKLLGNPARTEASPISIEINRDADARGFLGLWERFSKLYVDDKIAGRSVRLVTPGTGTDTADMPLVQVGDVTYRETSPLKYANSEVAELRVSCPDGERVVENDSEISVPRDSVCQVTAQLVNSGEASWVAAGRSSAAGACILHTSVGDAPVKENVARFGKTTVGPLRVEVHHNQVLVTGRISAIGRGTFGETLRLRVRPN
jgi:Beta-galactosidase